MKAFGIVLLLASINAHGAETWKDYLGCYQTVEVYKNKAIPEADRVRTKWKVKVSTKRTCGNDHDPCEEFWMEMADKKKIIKAYPYQILNGVKEEAISGGIKLTFEGPLYAGGELQYPDYYKRTELTRLDADHVRVLSVTKTDGFNTSFAEAKLQRVDCPTEN